MATERANPLSAVQHPPEAKPSVHARNFTRNKALEALCDHALRERVFGRELRPALGDLGASVIGALPIAWSLGLVLLKGADRIFYFDGCTQFGQPLPFATCYLCNGNSTRLEERVSDSGVASATFPTVVVYSMLLVVLTVRAHPAGWL